MIGLEVPGVLQIESIASFWFVYAAAAHRSPPRLGDGTIWVGATSKSQDQMLVGAADVSEYK